MTSHVDSSYRWAKNPTSEMLSADTLAEHQLGEVLPFRLRPARACAVALFLVCIGVSRHAGATLGGDGASVATNERSLGAERRIQKGSFGERHELTLPSGLVIQELVSPSGVVYGVAWRGPRMANLRELLGPYFGQLFSHVSRGSRNQLILSGDDFEIRAMGHQHSFAGRAWVPSLVPSGVDPDRELQ